MGGIRLVGVSKRFRRPQGNGDLIIFDRINLGVDDGKIVAIVGPSGCGKTTLLNLIALLEPADGGEVLIQGTPRLPSDVGTVSMGYLFQRDALLPWRTALGNALLGLECQGKEDTSSRELVTTYFERFGLRGFEEAWPETLSGGQRQRVALIQNLLPDPDILLLDEPFGSLDYQTKLVLEDELLGVIRPPEGSGRRKTVVFVTHDIEEAVVLADRVVVLGPPPNGVILDVDVPLADSLREPVAARQSEVMRRLFALIWEQLRIPEDKQSRVRQSPGRISVGSAG